MKREQRRTDGMRRIVRTLFEWPWTALVFFVLFFGSLMAIAYFFPPLYQVRALVFVKSGAEKSPLTYLPLGTMPTGNLATSMEDVNSEIAILTSRPVIEEVVDRRLASASEDPPSVGLKADLEDFQAWARSIGLLPEVDEREAAILALQNNLSVEPVPMSNVIEITFTSFSPKGAARTVNLLLDSYIKRHGETHRNADSLAFFQRQSEDFRVRLDAVEKELTQFRIDNEGGDLTLKRTLLLQELVTTEHARRSLEGVSEGEEELLSDSSLLENREISASRERLLNLKFSLIEKQMLYAPNSPEIQALTTQIGIARQGLADQMARLKVTLAKSESDLREQLREVERRRARFDGLIDQQARIKVNYDTYLRKTEEERITKAMEADQMISVRILERAAVPPKPYFPNRLILAILGLLFGIPGAIAAVLLKGYLYGRVASVEDVEEELEVPVLASIRRRPWWSFGKKKIPVDVVNAARTVESVLNASPAPTAGSGAQIVYFASVTRRDGAATLASAVARAAAAERGGRTALVLLGVAPDAVRVKESASASVSARVPVNVDASAKRAPETAVLDTLDLSQSRLVGLVPVFAELRECYDRVFVAGPPLTGRSDGASYVPLADRAVFVVGGSGVHFEVARRALAMLRQNSPEVIGAVLTQRRDAVPALIYRWM